MRLEVIHDQHAPLRLRIADIHAVLDLVRPVDFGAARRDGGPAPRRYGLADEEDVDHPAAFVFVVLARGMTGARRRCGARLAQELLGDLIHTDERTAPIVGPGVDGEHILHVPDKGSVGPWGDAPVLLQPGLEVVFLSVRRTV